MELVQLVYGSTATGDLSTEELRRIVESAVRHNTTNHITGMLLHSFGSFLQVLEGTEAAVDETMLRIFKDPCHQGIIILSVKKNPEREFANWAMGFRGVSADDVGLLPGYAPFFERGFDAERIKAKPGLAMELLRAFASSN
jgi:hypothetical protein